MSTTEKTLLTPAQAAERMQCSRSLLYAIIAEGRIKAIRIGQRGRRGKLLLPASEIERFLRECASE